MLLYFNGGAKSIFVRAQMIGFSQIFISYKYFKSYLCSKRKKETSIGDVLIIMSSVGIYAPPACADMTGRQQATEEGDQKEHRSLIKK